MPNYNLKTRYTVIPSYDVGNIPKLIFFDTAQRYMQASVCMFVVYVYVCVSLCACIRVCVHTYVHVQVCGGEGQKHVYVETCIFYTGMIGISSPAETTLGASVELSSYDIVDTTSSLGSIVGTTRVFTSDTQSDGLQRTDVTPSTPAEPSLIPATVTSSQPSPTSTTGTMICIFQSCRREIRITHPPHTHTTS